MAARYAGASRFARGFVRGKLRRDPASAAILALGAATPFGAVVDCGCGRGQLGLALLLAGAAERLVGLDRNPGKIAEARQAAAGLPARFEQADLATAPVPACDTVLLIDVLLQMPEPAQRALLARVAAAARRRILIRAFDPSLGWRARLGFAMERLGRRVRGDGVEIRPLPLPALRHLLEEAGFGVTVTPCWAGTPLPNMLLRAERRGAVGPAAPPA
ncbi:methyltransferase domain-containing protein [Roseicella frigidaeris]|uniref:methyltransferase domain-containing protein n=1 Tax=Roseicella frigidaeris TaxID=2230885 RepID=UPI001402C64A|nr:methyltransferase domain-containing protein [Roseicella frigidaeris]